MISGAGKELCTMTRIALCDFPTWKTVRLGTYPATADLRTALTSAGCSISNWASDILDKTTLATEETEVELVRILVAELGFKWGATRAQIYDRAREFGFDLCPAEVGPQLRQQYPDQPMGEWIRVGMEPITVSDGVLSVFHVACFGSGLWLRAGYGVNPGDRWGPGGRWVFVRRKP